MKKYLRCKKGKYRRRYGTKKREKQGELAKKKRIDTRPECIDDRERIGDWEGDTVMGEKGTGVFATHVERLSGYCMIDRLERAVAELFKDQTITRFKTLPQSKIKTITYDNGKENERHETIEEKLGVDIYFAYPYHSWERGCNENFNGLIRHFIQRSLLLPMLRGKIRSE